MFVEKLNILKVKSKVKIFDFVVNIVKVKNYEANEVSKLSFPDQKIFDSLLTEKRKKEFLYSRLAFLEVIGVIIKEGKRKNIQIEKGCFGQPVLSGCDEFDVSLTHDSTFAVVAVFSQKLVLGIDIQEVNKRNINSISMLEVNKIGQSNFFEDYPNFRLEEYATVIWTAKEALGKAIRTGFTADPLIFEISGLLVSPEKCFQVNFKYFPNFICQVYMISNSMFSIVFPSEYTLYKNEC